MARQRRILYPGAIYHVMARGNNGRPIIRTSNDHRVWYKVLNQYAELFKVNIYAHVEMVNHYHILLETPFGNLSEFMRDFQRKYVQEFKKSHNHRGYLFQDRYKAILVQKEKYFLTVFRYIHTNPLTAGIVKELSRYRWSSYGEYLGIYESHVRLYREEIVKFFPGDFKEDFKRFHEKSVEHFSADTVRGISYYGDESFGKNIIGKVERRQKRKLWKIIPIDKLEAAISKIVSEKVRKIMRRSRYPEGIWRARVVYLSREMCGTGYVEMGKRWDVKPSRLAQQYSRYARNMSKKEREELSKLRLFIVNQT